MEYKDRRYGFSFEIPDGWTRDSGLLKKLKDILGGIKVDAEIFSKERDASINIMCGSIDREVFDASRRDRAMIQCFASRGVEMIRTGSINDCIGGEKNTVEMNYRYPNQKAGSSITKISCVRENGIEYCITMAGDHQKYKEDFEKVKRTFSFVKES